MRSAEVLPVVGEQQPPWTRTASRQQGPSIRHSQHTSTLPRTEEVSKKHVACSGEAPVPGPSGKAQPPAHAIQTTGDNPSCVTGPTSPDTGLLWASGSSSERRRSELRNDLGHFQMWGLCHGRMTLPSREKAGDSGSLDDRPAGGPTILCTLASHSGLPGPGVNHPLDPRASRDL